MKIQYLLSIAFILLSFAAGIYLYPQLPDPMPSHWNASGEVDGYMAKDTALFLMPCISIFIFGLFLLIPKIDPLKKNIEKFRSYYDWFIAFMIAFLAYMYFATIAWALGYRFSMNVAILPPMALLFYFIGMLCENSKRNWFIGIRTPWTMSSDKVWEKTNRLGGKIFRAMAVILLLLIFIPSNSIIILIALVAVAAVYPIVYSYFEYQKEIKKK